MWKNLTIATLIIGLIALGFNGYRISTNLAEANLLLSSNWEHIADLSERLDAIDESQDVLAAQQAGTAEQVEAYDARLIAVLESWSARIEAIEEQQVVLTEQQTATAEEAEAIMAIVMLNNQSQATEHALIDEAFSFVIQRLVLMAQVIENRRSASDISK